MAKQINTILSLKDKMSSPLTKVSNNVTKVTREMKKSQNQIEKWGKNAVKSIDNVVKRTAKIGLAFGTLAGGLAIKSGFSEAMDLEGFRVQLETATKDAKKAGEIMKWTIDLANKTPFEAGPLVEGASKLEMMGMSAKKWLPLLGDMAAATNKPIDQAVEAMIDSTTGELERMKEFGLTKVAISKRAGEMFRGQEVVNAKGQIVDQEKFNEAIVSLMEERYKGGMDKLSNTTKGLWSTITGVTKSGLATIVGMTSDGTIRQGSMLAMLKEKIKLVANMFDKWQKDGTINKIASNVTNAVTKMINFFKSLFNFIKKHEKVITTIVVFAASIYTVVKAITVVVAMYEAWIVISTVLDGVLKLSTLGWIVLAIGAVVAVGYLLYRNWDKIKAKAKELGGVFAEFGGKYIMTLINTFKNLVTIVWDIVVQVLSAFKPILDNLKILFGNIVEIISPFIGILSVVAGFVLGVFVAKIVYGFMLMVNQLKAVITMIIGIFSGFVSILTGVSQFIVGSFTGNWTMAWEGVKNVFSGIVGIIKSIWQGFVDYITAPVDAIVNILDGVFKEKVAGIKRLWEGLKTFLKNPIKGVVNLFKKTSEGGSSNRNTRGMQEFAKGGIANRPSIFGEAGAEMAIPLKRNNPRSQMLLEKTNKIVNGNNGGGSPVSVSVTIAGNVYGEADLINRVGSAIQKKVSLAIQNS